MVETQDHPRVCGENLTPSGELSSILGSPPRVRGKPMSNTIERYDYRITPACAGKTARREFICYVHAGSPPRVRGKRRMAASSFVC